MPDPSHLMIARAHGTALGSADLRAAAEELAGSSATQDGCLGFEVLAPQRGVAGTVHPLPDLSTEPQTREPSQPA